MQAAQKLYEGVDIGGESGGLITYMRTDGVSYGARGAAWRPAQVIAGRLRPALRPREPAHLQDQGQERPGGARSHNPDLAMARSPD